MKLLIDIGNCRIKWAFAADGRFLAEGEALRDDGPGLRALLESGWSPDDIRISNVAGAAAGAQIAATLQSQFHRVPAFARSAATGAGVTNGYADSAMLGVDRWLAICAAFVRHRAPVCVVDAGTATTIDLVTGGGQHMGGLILPGMELMQSVLFRETGDLARLSGVTGGRLDPNPVERPILLGRDTAAAIRYGALQATVSLVRACMDELSASPMTGATPPVVIVTGGSGPALLAECLRVTGTPGFGLATGFRTEFRAQLVLEGLALDPLCFQVVP